MADKTVKSPAAQARYSLRELLGYFLYLGAVGFGGPVALVGYMRRDLVERRNWFTEAEYNEGLALSQLSPGPLAGQLAMYLGFVHYGVYGATLTGVVFVLPSFLMVLALGWAYVAFGGLPWMQSVFYGVGAVVIAIIAFSAYRLATRTLKRDTLLWIIFLTLMLATALTGRESVLLILAGGLLAWLVKAPPRRRIPPNAPLLVGLAAPGVTGALIGWPIRWGLLGQIALFFTKAGAFVFGSGLAIVPFLYGGVVHELKWLNDRQFLDAVAVAMITPGPVVITAGFIGYLVARLPGSIVAAAATFLPPYLVVILAAPHFKRWSAVPSVQAIIQGVTAAATGAIAGAVIVLARRSLVDGPTVLLAVLALAVLWRWKVPEPLLVLAAALAGLLIRTLVAAH
jgi:chromate transporter